MDRPGRRRWMLQTTAAVGAAVVVAGVATAVTALAAPTAGAAAAGKSSPLSPAAPGKEVGVAAQPLRELGLAAIGEVDFGLVWDAGKPSSPLSFRLGKGKPVPGPPKSALNFSGESIKQNGSA
ncbi:hypothetical protein I4F81_001659 [Pyropia yezoensis]|uniref:Uncharacterized protein n=1 Tax=Pyropia yezoensis TaxID=2788 RepID=A0ACC3BMT2_PYRYE|nr:hypothetical protein I4F81_001659 [Neopyropia yezoensis]